MSDMLCKKCNEFFGNEATQFLCSTCYKQYKIDNPVMQTQINTNVKQEDHTHCFKCQRKIGLLGHKCNTCDCSYCKFHRLPQQHDCSIDYKALARKEIQKKNPNMTAPKIQPI